MKKTITTYSDNLCITKREVLDNKGKKILPKEINKRILNKKFTCFICGGNTHLTDYFFGLRKCDACKGTGSIQVREGLGTIIDGEYEVEQGFKVVVNENNTKKEYVYRKLNNNLILEEDS